MRPLLARRPSSHESHVKDVFMPESHNPSQDVSGCKLKSRIWAIPSFPCNVSLLHFHPIFSPSSPIGNIVHPASFARRAHILFTSKRQIHSGLLVGSPSHVSFSIIFSTSFHSCIILQYFLWPDLSSHTQILFLRRRSFPL